MLIREYRVVNNCTVGEYQVAQLFMVVEASKEETGGGDGVEIHINEPYENETGKGQYTKKTYHLSSKVPGWVRALAPAGSLELYEEAWNGYPYCKTVLTNGWMKDKFQLVVETMHIGDSKGEVENALKLSDELLKQREVVLIDIVNDPVEADVTQSLDPTKFKSEKTNRGPLSKDWLQEVSPTMTCYKLVTCEFKWFGLQTRVESFIHRTMQTLFTKTHRQLFCLTDNWYGLTMQDIRKLEEKTQKELNEKRQNDGFSGSKAL